MASERYFAARGVNYDAQTSRRRHNDGDEREMKRWQGPSRIFTSELTLSLFAQPSSSPSPPSPISSAPAAAGSTISPPTPRPAPSTSATSSLPSSSSRAWRCRRCWRMRG